MYEFLPKCNYSNYYKIFLDLLYILSINTVNKNMLIQNDANKIYGGKAFSIIIAGSSIRNRVHIYWKCLDYSGTKRYICVTLNWLMNMYAMNAWCYDESLQFHRTCTANRRTKLQQHWVIGHNCRVHFQCWKPFPMPKQNCGQEWTLFLHWKEPLCECKTKLLLFEGLSDIKAMHCS